MCANESTDNLFKGKKVVAIGFFVNHSRKSMHKRLLSLGAKPIDKVSRFTDFLIVGEKPGEQLAKAQRLEITILTEEQFEAMLNK